MMHGTMNLKFFLNYHYVLSSFINYFPTNSTRNVDKSEIPIPLLCVETLVVRKWGKTKENDGTIYEASTCFMARDVSEK
jgi:hypothetical protein